MPGSSRHPHAPIGAFTLKRPIGQGAQGTVWEAVHRYRGAVVALKVLHTDVAPHFRRLEQEAAAMARLAHPGVVAVLDVGQVTAEEATDTLAQGAPWLAMELVRGARPLGPARDWREAVGALLAMLDALAHCHARDVVHRDLKPGNILTREGRVCLTDFGLAWLGHDDDARLRAGTPPYMAPEQFLGRAVGPSTDLYALGCVAAFLVQGRPPFQATTMPELRDLHLYQPPQTDPSIPVPEGFGPWLEGMLAKRPGDRFPSAAHAADALAALGPPQTGASTPSQPSIDALTWATNLPHSVVLDPVQSQGRDLAVERRAHRPVPSTWRTSYPVALDDIHRSGFGLHALREPPLVGRDAERDHLWDALREVAATGRGRVLHLVGPQGSGRRALTRWLFTRAAELAVASTKGPPGPGPHLRAVDESADGIPEGTLTLVRCTHAPTNADVVTVGRLSEGEIRRLLDHRVRLDPLLTARLAWQADGHPGRAIQILTSVVPHLIDGPDGAVWPPDRPLPPPQKGPQDAEMWGDRCVHRDQETLRADHPDLLIRARAVEPTDPDAAERWLLEALSRPHLPLMLPALALGTIDAVRAFLERQKRPPTDPLWSHADILEAWLAVNLHLNQRAIAVAERVLKRSHARPESHRDAHLILTKAYRGGDPTLRLHHIRASDRFPLHALPAYRLRHWRSMLITLRDLGAHDEIDQLLDTIEADEALRIWAQIERTHEARRRGQPFDLPAVLDACQRSEEPELLKAAAGLAFACGHFAEGEALLRGLMERGHDTAIQRCNLGWIVASQGRLDEVPELITTIVEADADVLSSVALLKAFVHAADPQLDVEAYLDRFQPFLIGEPFAEHTCELLEDLAQRAESASLHARAVMARRHAAWLRQRSASSKR